MRKPEGVQTNTHEDQTHGCADLVDPELLQPVDQVGQDVARVALAQEAFGALAADLGVVPRSRGPAD